MTKTLKERCSTLLTCVKVGASIGGAAVIGCLLKKADVDVKGIKKIVVPLGIFGLAHAAGTVAGEAAKNEVGSYLDMADEVKGLIIDDEDKDVVEEETPEEEE